MKSSRMLSLLVIAMMSATVSAVNVEDYLIGDKVDAKGQTFLHQLAENCDNDDFQVEIKLFDFMEKKLPEELMRHQKEMDFIFFLPKDVGFLLMLAKVAEMIETTDNNNETALDILERKNRVKNPCARCLVGMELLKDLNNNKAELFKK